MAKPNRPVNRPKNLNLLTIRLPMPAVVSILHRISGAGLFLLLPAVLWVLFTSLESSTGYEVAWMVLKHPFVKLLVLGISWAYLHHACAGIRHLALDAHLGLRLKYARASSRIVLIVSGLITLYIGILLW
jgi:succinate dehydrogenase / fumarate reductase, cytochrome b subunit